MLWKFKFLWNFICVLVRVIRSFDERLWMRHRKNGTGNRWALMARKSGIEFRREKAGAPMTKAQAQQWETHQVFQISEEKELQQALSLLAVNLITWISLLRMEDEIESKIQVAQDNPDKQE